MKFTKAQSAILEEIGNTNKVSNYHFRLNAVRPLLDAGIIKRTVIYDNDGLSLGYHWELV
jgi:hypothetical protein